MIYDLATLLWILSFTFVAMLFFSYRGTVSNSRISLFSIGVVVYESGDDTFNAIENETENETEE